MQILMKVKENMLEGEKKILLWPCLALLLMIFLGSSFVHTCECPSITNVESGDRFTDLQEAIDAASSGDTLIVNGTNVGNFIITKDLILKGCGAVLDGNQTASVVTIFTPGGSDFSIDVALIGLTIQNGLGIPTPSVDVPGGGGILNINANLAVINSRIRDNVSPFESGGGILSVSIAGVGDPIIIPPFSTAFPASLVLIESQVSNNQTGMSGGGVVNSTGFLEITNCRITSNIANESGGGIFSFAGLNNIKDTKIAHNAAVLQGGGLENVVLSFTNLTNVHFIENTAGQGGGLANSDGGVGPIAGSFINISDSKFKGNNTQTLGGGIYNNLGSVAIVNRSSITRNGAASGGGIFNLGVLDLNRTEVKKNLPNNVVNL